MFIFILILMFILILIFISLFILDNLGNSNLTYILKLFACLFSMVNGWMDGWMVGWFYQPTINRTALHSVYHT